MMTFDLNRIALFLMIITLAIIAVLAGYRLEIGTGGIKLEKPSVEQTQPVKT